MDYINLCNPKKGNTMNKKKIKNKSTKEVIVPVYPPSLLSQEHFNYEEIKDTNFSFIKFALVSEKPTATTIVSRLSKELPILDLDLIKSGTSTATDKIESVTVLSKESQGIEVEIL